MQDQTLADLAKAVKEYDGPLAADLADQALKAGTDPKDVLGALTDAIREVGDAFGTGELFLPELVSAAEATEAAMPIVEAAFKASGGSRESVGKVVAGTVAGDIHNIGKTIFCTLLRRTDSRSSTSASTCRSTDSSRRSARCSRMSLRCLPC